MSIYQQIREKFIMPDAWEDWTSYREKLTDLILRMKPASLLIVGAGRCNDLDLRRLSAELERVVLLDMDEEGMQHAAALLPEELRKKTDIRTVSLTGICTEDMERFCDGLFSAARSSAGAPTVETFRRHLDQSMDELEGKLIKREEELLRRLPENAPEILICSGVHSQLFSQLSFYLRSLLHSLKEFLPGISDLEKDVTERIRSMNDQVIPVINRALLEYAGRSVIFGNEYMPGSPVEGADQCIRNVREFMHPREMHFTWMFNRREGITYDMLIQVCDADPGKMDEV